jgi:hypothetical protein
MTPFVRNSVLGGSFVFLCFSAIIYYSARQMPIMTAESKRTIDTYFLHIKAKDYNNARNLLAQGVQSEISTDQLKNVWQKFEKNNGKFEKWVPSDASSDNGGRVCLFPPYVDYLLRAYGTNGDQVLYMRIAPKDGKWVISQMREVRQDK